MTQDQKRPTLSLSSSREGAEKSKRKGTIEVEIHRRSSFSSGKSLNPVVSSAVRPLPSSSTKKIGISLSTLQERQRQLKEKQETSPSVSVSFINQVVKKKSMTSTKSAKQKKPALKAAGKREKKLAGAGSRKALTVVEVLSPVSSQEKTYSLASQKRRHEKMGSVVESSPLPPLPPPPSSVQKVVRDVVISGPMTVADLSNRMAETKGEVVKKLMVLGVMASVTQTIDADTAQLVAEEFGHRVKRVDEALMEEALLAERDVAEQLVERSPVVVIMGHVDHGKTTLLDALRQSCVATSEKAGITQHIGAYQVAVRKKLVTFIDTPGHAIFTRMRARGTEGADIVVLVIAADDSVKPQTREAIAHAKAAGVGFVIAINKVDLPGADPSKVRQDLLQCGIVDESLGGDVQSVEISATKKTNLDGLIEAIFLQSEVMELKGNMAGRARAVVIETSLSLGRGPVVTVLVKKGVLKKEDIFVVGSKWGRVRALRDDKDREIPQASLSMPVLVLGVSGLPKCGDLLMVVETEALARRIAETRERQEKNQHLALRSKKPDKEEDAAASPQKKTLPIIVKTDVHGSMEAIVGALEKMQNEEVSVSIPHAAVGEVTETDVLLAKATGANIFAFNIKTSPHGAALAMKEKVSIKRFNVIYELVEEIADELGFMLTPAVTFEKKGQALVKEVFGMKKGKVAGCILEDGEITHDALLTVKRGEEELFRGVASSLRHFKDEVRSVGKTRQEFGIVLKDFQEFKEGDIIEAFEEKHSPRVFQETRSSPS